MTSRCASVSEFPQRCHLSFGGFFSVRIRCRVVLRHLQLVCVEFNDLAAGAFSLALEVCNKLAHTGPIDRSSDDVGRSSRSRMAMLLHVPKMGTPCPLFEKRGLRRTVSIKKARPSLIGLYVSSGCGKGAIPAPSFCALALHLILNKFKANLWACQSTSPQ